MSSENDSFSFMKGGGFLVVILAKELDEVKQIVEEENVEEYASLTWHTCSVDEVGLSVELLPEC